MAGAVYIAIDLKSFYASVECRERKLNPLNTNLVVADEDRTEKTICLAVSPTLKTYGIPGRARLFEVVQRIREVNLERKRRAVNRQLLRSSYYADELSAHPEYEVSFITAKPRMALYVEYSTRIYDIYLRYVAPEDIHVYSIDEVFMDVSAYLDTYRMSAQELAGKIIQDIVRETGITATAGIGTNLYLCKVALDIMSKHVRPNADGVCIGVLDEMSYRRLLWDHQPLTDFWRVGQGYQKKLHENGLYTMGDIAKCSLGGPLEYYNEDLLYHLFGVNAELLIDHAWGYEPVTMEHIKAYRPQTNCLSSGQVLHCPYDYEKTKLIVKEMSDMLALDLVEKKLVTDQLVLTIGYDIDNLSDDKKSQKYKGEITTDHYGRKIPKHAHGTANLERKTASARLITEAVLDLYAHITDRKLWIRRINLTANHLVREETVRNDSTYEQLTLFSDYDTLKKERQKEEEKLAKERKLQEAMLAVKKRYGKNSMLKGMNLLEGATAIERNNQIGGHRA